MARGEKDTRSSSYFRKLQGHWKIFGIPCDPANHLSLVYCLLLQYKLFARESSMSGKNNEKTGFISEQTSRYVIVSQWGLANFVM